MKRDITKNNDAGCCEYFECYARTKLKSSFDLAKILQNVVVFIARFDDTRVRSKPKLRTIFPLAFDDSFNVQVKLK